MYQKRHHEIHTVLSNGMLMLNLKISLRHLNAFPRLVRCSILVMGLEIDNESFIVFLFIFQNLRKGLSKWKYANLKVSL